MTAARLRLQVVEYSLQVVEYRLQVVEYSLSSMHPCSNTVRFMLSQVYAEDFCRGVGSMAAARSGHQFRINWSDVPPSGRPADDILPRAGEGGRGFEIEKISRDPESMSHA